MKQNKLIKCLALLAMMIGGTRSAWSVDVTTSTFASAYSTAQAADSDTELVLATGDYTGNGLAFPSTNKVTIKAAPGAIVTFTGNFACKDGQSGGLEFDGIKIYPKTTYFIEFHTTKYNAGNVIFKNCEITKPTSDAPSTQHCIIRARSIADGSGNKSSINNIEFDNCKVHDWGVNGEGPGNEIVAFEDVNAVAKAVTFKNSTFYNLNNKEILLVKGQNTDQTLTIDFINNTVYKVGASNKSLIEVQNGYKDDSQYNIKDNILSTAYDAPATPTYKEATLNGDGTKTIKNNIVVNYSSKAGDDYGVTFFGGSATEIPFFDPAKGDFTLSTIAYPTLSTGGYGTGTGGPIGDAEWLQNAYMLNEDKGFSIDGDVASTNVRLKRTITAGNWSTIVLPFALTAEQVTSVFGTNVKVAELSSGNATTLNFSTATSMTANKPYAIKVENGEYTSPKTINGVTIVNATPTQSITNWDFEGTYSSTTVPEGSYYFKSNKLYQRSAGHTTTMKPFRAYLTYTGGSPAPALNFIIDGDVTGIAHINADGQMNLEEGAVYNLNGQRVANPTKGLYIVNGKKTIIK